MQLTHLLLRSSLFALSKGGYIVRLIYVEKLNKLKTINYEKSIMVNFRNSSTDLDFLW